MATHSSILAGKSHGQRSLADSSFLAWKIPWTEGLAGYSLWGHKESDTTD